MAEFLISVALLAVFLVVLVKSAMLSIESIIKFSKITGIGELAAGFVIVAVATSVPEISVAVFSTYGDNVGLTLGDIFGSNVTNIGLIAAIFLLFSPVRKIETKTIRGFVPLLLASSLIPLLLLLAQQGNKFIGIALLGAFAFFIYRTFKAEIRAKNEIREKGSPYKPFFYFLVGIAIVIVSSKIIVDSASSIAEITGLRESVIGATIISLGTSLPELTVGVVAVRKKHLDLSLGNIIGSCITNITLVLGIVLVLSVAEINFGILSTLVTFAIFMPLAFFVFIRKGTVKKWQSISLFAIYATFLIIIYEVQTIIGGIHFP